MEDEDFDWDALDAQFDVCYPDFYSYQEDDGCFEVGDVLVCCEDDGLCCASMDD